MANSTMPASTVVSVTAQILTPVSIQLANPNQFLFLTTEEPINASAIPYKYYTDASVVAKDYGFTSKTYKVASIIFSQQPNILQGNGSLAIAPLVNATSATYASFKTEQITSTIVSNFASVSNGAIDVNADGVVYQLRALNFTGASTVTDILNIMASAILQYGSVLTDTSVPPALVFSTKTPGGLATGTQLPSFALQAPSVVPPGATDLSGTNYFNITGATTTAGVNSSGETLQQAVVRLRGESNAPQFYSVITNLVMDQDAILSMAQYCQTNPQGQPLMFEYCFYSRNACQPNGTATLIVENGYSNTRTPLNFQDPIACIAGYTTLSSVDFQQPGSAYNAIPGLNKKLIGVPADVVDQDELDTFFIPAGVDLYLNVAGQDGIARPSGANGGFFDTIYFTNYLSLEIQNTYAIALAKQTVTANPQGQLQLQNIGNDLMQQAVLCGMLTAGLEWTNPIPSGIPPSYQTSFFRNITDTGFFVYVAPFTNRTNTQISLRQAPPMAFAGVLTGSVNKLFANLFLQQG